MDTVKKWFVSQQGFISLNHDINPTTSSAAIMMVQAIQAAQNAGTFPFAENALKKDLCDPVIHDWLVSLKKTTA